MVAFTFACRKNEPGPQGPAGQQGIQGEKGNDGAQGFQGVPGEDGLMREGFIEGTITGTNRSGEPISETFRYEYLNSLGESVITDYEGLGFVFSRRAAKEANSFFYLNLEYVYENEEGDFEVDPHSVGLSFSFIKDLGNGKYFKFANSYSSGNWGWEKVARTGDTPILWFYNSSSTIDIKIISFNRATGRLSFEYTVNLHEYENISYNSAEIKGRGIITVREEIARKGNF